MGIFLVGARLFSTPRVLKPSEVPIAFWAWRNEIPDTSDLEPVISQTHAKLLFLRAGQFDEIDGKINWIRPAKGRFPSGIELHLVYNGTRRFLQSFEKIDPEAAGAAFLETYSKDAAQAKADGADVRGIQLDLDVPERLLPQYAAILAKLRERLPAESKLSITGLPSWLGTTDIKSTLSHVDFWIPQCYGAAIPTNINQHIPISNAIEVARSVAKARELNKPFWAGLSAYGYAILYGTDGELIELRGDIDPATAAKDGGLELLDPPHSDRADDKSENRLVYRARNDVVLDGLVIRPGESLVFDIPSSASLRAAARAVRENAGQKLLGICVFRLPQVNDRSVLSVAEIAAALSDRKPIVSTKLEIAKITNDRLRVNASNDGEISNLGETGLTIDLHIPAGVIRGVAETSGFSGYETLCQGPDRASPMPCSELRANVIRLRASAWRTGDYATATLIVGKGMPTNIQAQIRSGNNNTDIVNESFQVQLDHPGE